ncbi:DUF2752 domain-containing protein [Nocardioides aurantiacus]|uniref:Uncharacterized protein DUF2752 n=1 Tax=Nocardioides aurantiacus TaxID=86796 RepID=A0A3N2CV75_9ACTN|nr:DUF2752 domain-containing protein [Nocardioides aurantiacus]ROR91440.1 uncharacterized protein DUF2752 [Nocardioides aurantiacus]
MRPGEAPGRARRLRAPLLTAGAVGLAVAALAVRDPHTQGSWGTCPYLAATGLYCPGCGILRGVHDVAHGDPGAALSSNLVFFGLVAPVLVLAWALWTRRAWTGRPRAGVRPGRVARTSLVVAAVLLTLVFTVARNTPQGAWLAP